MTAVQWAAVVGFVLPGFVAMINREEWKSWVKAVVALVTSVVVGAVTAFLSGSFTGASWVTVVGIVFTAAVASYKFWWKGSGISDKIEQAINLFPAGKTPSEPALGGAPGGSGGAVTTGKHSIDG